MSFVTIFFTEREPQTICYLTNWSHKRPGAGKFMPEDIDPTLCTHVVYAFATLKEHLLSEGSDKDGEMYERLIALREKNPDIKVSVYKRILTKNRNTKYLPLLQIATSFFFIDIVGHWRVGLRFNSVQRTYEQYFPHESVCLRIN